MKIGLVLANYNCNEYLEKCFSSWFEFKQNNNLLISVVDGRFKFFGGNTQNSNDGSLTFLENNFKNNNIDFFTKLQEDYTEHDARNIALKPLLENNCDYIFTLGTDELYKIGEINKIFNFVKLNPFIAAFHINFKNLVWDNQYLDGFCPRRIWKSKLNNYKLIGFNNDDDCFYINILDNIKLQDTLFPTLKIPKSIVFVEHHTWNNIERSRKKIEYQNSRPGWLCSFEYKDGKIQFCKEYYKKTGESLPKLIKL